MMKLCAHLNGCIGGLGIAGLLLAFNTNAATAKELTIINHGKSRFQIVIASNAILSERYAAEELQRYLEKISGAKLPITTDAAPLRIGEILLGDNAHVQKSGLDLALDRLGSEGFIIRTEGQRLILAG